MESLARQQEQGILCKHSTILSLAGTSELADIYESCVCNGMKFAGIRSTGLLQVCLVLLGMHILAMPHKGDRRGDFCVADLNLFK